MEAALAVRCKEGMDEPDLSAEETKLLKDCTENARRAVERNSYRERHLESLKNGGEIPGRFGSFTEFFRALQDSD